MTRTVERWSFPASVVVNGNNEEDAREFVESLLDAYMGVTLAGYVGDYFRDARLYIQDEGQAHMEDGWTDDDDDDERACTTQVEVILRVDVDQVWPRGDDTAELEALAKDEAKHATYRNLGVQWCGEPTNATVVSMKGVHVRWKD